MRDHELAFWMKGMFEDGKFQSSLKNSHRKENFGFRCRAMPIINYNIDAYSTMFATYRVKVSENW